MRAALLDQPGRPLRIAEVEEPVAGPGQLRLRVEACGVCRTDLHLRDGEVDAGHLPLVLGHQIVGLTDDGRRVGVPWLGWTCGECAYCRSGRENLCVRARFTGRDIDGGYAEFAVADERFCFDLPADADPLQLAPLLCGGLIGHRALRLAGDGRAARASTASAPPRTSSARWRWPRGGACSRSPARRTLRLRSSRGRSARSGRATRWRPGRSRWTRR